MSADGSPPGAAPPTAAPAVSLDALRTDEAGLVPVVVQQHDTGQVLMVAWADRTALAATIDGGETVFWSRSRRELWHKGATSGDTQTVIELRVDCDADVVLALVDQHGRGACHTGEPSCFGRHLAGGPTGPAAAAPAPWDAAVRP